LNTRTLNGREIIKNDQNLENPKATLLFTDADIKLGKEVQLARSDIGLIKESQLARTVSGKALLKNTIYRSQDEKSLNLLKKTAPLQSQPTRTLIKGRQVI
jgi:hypothetical protein